MQGRESCRQAGRQASRQAASFVEITHPCYRPHPYPISMLSIDVRVSPSIRNISWCCSSFVCFCLLFSVFRLVWLSACLVVCFLVCLFMCLSVCFMYCSLLVVCRSSFIDRCSSFVARRSSVVRSSSLIAHRSSLVARRSSLVARRLPYVFLTCSVYVTASLSSRV